MATTDKQEQSAFDLGAYLDALANKPRGVVGTPLSGRFQLHLALSFNFGSGHVTFRHDISMSPAEALAKYARENGLTYDPKNAWRVVSGIELEHHEWVTSGGKTDKEFPFSWNFLAFNRRISENEWGSTGDFSFQYQAMKASISGDSSGFFPYIVPTNAPAFVDFWAVLGQANDPTFVADDPTTHHEWNSTTYVKDGVEKVAPERYTYIKQVFASKDELVEWLVANGVEVDAKESAPSIPAPQLFLDAEFTEDEWTASLAGFITHVTPVVEAPLPVKPKRRDEAIAALVDWAGFVDVPSLVDYLVEKLSE